MTINNIAGVKLSKYDTNWINLFNLEKEKISKALRDKIISIEHIGSTSIPSCVAKPEIDILIGVKNIKDAKDLVEPLKKIEYAYYPRFEEFIPERRYFRKSRGSTPLAHIHMVEIDSDFYKDHIFFRDYLKNNPSLIEKYNNLKLELVDKFNGDREKYSKGKENFVLEVVKITKKL